MTTAEHVRVAIDAWKQADAAARDAEKRLAEASLASFERVGPQVPDDLIGDARLLRSLANRKLAEAMSLMNPGARKT